MRMLADRIEALPEFNHQGLENAVRALSEELGVKAGVLMNACRVALTGQAVAPGLFDVMGLLGRERTIARLREINPASRG
jgi:glutamyl-tRNA synthetase